MITFGINLAGILLNTIKPMKLTVGSSSNALKCRIVEMTEQQNYDLPSFPIDKGEYRTDTIYKQPLIVTLRVFVESKDIDSFIKAVNQAQFSEKLFTISSLYNQTYKNLKIVSYARDTNATMLNATHYNIQFQEVVMVQALAQSYKSQKNAGYAGAKQTGNKAPAVQKKSALLEGSNAIGFFK